MTPNTLPLPLELAPPIFLAGALDATFRAGLHIGRYDPKAQVNLSSLACETSSESSAESNTTDSGGLLVIDAQTDAALLDDILQDFENTGFSETSSESEAQSNTTDDTGLIVIDAQTDFAVADDILQDFLNG
jgi:hypothetical protein